MSTTIKEALLNLSPEDDTLWTEDGVPTVTAISNAVGSPVTRKQITEALPGFSRKSAVEPAPKVEVKEEDYTSLNDREFYSKISSLKDFQLEDIVSELTENINQFTVTIQELKDKIELYRKRAYWAKEKLDMLNPPASLQDTIQQYLEKQKEKNGVGTLSKAMSRKTGFARPRPSYPTGV